MSLKTTKKSSLSPSLLTLKSSVASRVELKNHGSVVVNRMSLVKSQLFG